MAAIEIIVGNPFNPVRCGYVERLSDGRILYFTQNPMEIDHGVAMLFEIDAPEIKIDDLACLLSGLPFESKIMVPLPGIYDIHPTWYKVLASRDKEGYTHRPWSWRGAQI